MTDPLKKHLDKLKIIAESAKRRNNMYADLAKLQKTNRKGEKITWKLFQS